MRLACLVVREEIHDPVFVLTEPDGEPGHRLLLVADDRDGRAQELLDVVVLSVLCLQPDQQPFRDVCHAKSFLVLAMRGVVRNADTTFLQRPFLRIRLPHSRTQEEQMTPKMTKLIAPLMAVALLALAAPALAAKGTA